MSCLEVFKDTGGAIGKELDAGLRLLYLDSEVGDLEIKVEVEALKLKVLKVLHIELSLGRVQPLLHHLSLMFLLQHSLILNLSLLNQLTIHLIELL